MNSDRARIVFMSFLVVIAATTSFLIAEPPPQKPQLRSPLSPQQALLQFRVDPGLRVELVASEPVVESPVAMAFDEDGKLWVVEMRDYPNGPAPGKPPEGRIRVLEDRDGDGLFEQSRVFADQLLFANGLMPWKGGVIVTAAPHVLYLRDTDGDGKADHREVLFEGFTAKNPQLRVNHPTLGMDNWVYLANGILGGVIKRSGQANARPVDINGMDFRFDPHNPDRHEAIAGVSQYGLTFDDWGRRFVCTNRNHVIPMVVADRYVKRNPFLVAPGPVMPNQGLGGAAKVYPLSKHWTTYHGHHGTFTSACSVFVYRGNLLPAAYRGATFTCEPAGNLIHEEKVRPSGSSFEFRPGREGLEFLATPDEWCRPVFLSDGPDGGLYFVDMYRAVIEHPEYMPQELKKRPDLTLGKERGRIWRIVAEGNCMRSSAPKLSKAANQELIDLLASQDGWWRSTAHRLLLERQDRASIPGLIKKAASSTSPLARVHAAHLLDSLGVLDEDIVQKLLAHDHPGVREHAVSFAERWLAKSKPLQELVLFMAADPDARVRFQVALSLGEWDDDRIVESLVRIAQAGVDDRWTRLAAASSVPRRAGALIAAILKASDRLNPNQLVLLQELASVVGARHDREEVSRVLETAWSVSSKDALRWQLAALNGLAEGMGRRGIQLGTFVKSLPKSSQPIDKRLDENLLQAANVAENRARPQVERLDAIRLLAHASWPIAESTLTRLLEDDREQEIRLAAVRAMAAHSRPEVAEILLKSWKGYLPAVRREVTEALLQSPQRTEVLLAKIEAGAVKPGDLDPLRVRQAAMRGSPEARARAKKLLENNLPEARKKVLDRYRVALTLAADPKRGREVFQKNCATCHQVAGVGQTVGPEIADTRTKLPEQLLTDILNPNQAIDNNYVNYVVTTRTGKVLTGIISAQDSSSITLRRAENQTDHLLRQDIEEIQSTGMSLMPEDVEKNISVEQMADLIAFLKNWRYLDGDVPLGKPD